MSKKYTLPADVRLECIAYVRDSFKRVVALADDEDMQKRWKFFLKTIKDNTLEFSFVITEIQTFLEPVFDVIVNEKELRNLFLRFGGDPTRLCRLPERLLVDRSVCAQLCRNLDALGCCLAHDGRRQRGVGAVE